MKHKIEIAPYSVRLYLLHNGFTSNLTSLAFCSSRQVTPIIAFLHDNPQMPYLLVPAESAVGREIVSAVSMQDTNFTFRSWKTVVSSDTSFLVYHAPEIRSKRFVKIWLNWFIKLLSQKWTPSLY